MNKVQSTFVLAPVVTVSLGLAACSSDTRAVATPGNPVEAKTLVGSSIGEPVTTITLLGFDGCPLTPLMKTRLEAVLAQFDESIKLVQVDQNMLDSSDLRRGYPAPTVLVGGSDLFGMAPPTAPSMGCRMYDGPGGVPSVEDLSNRLGRVLQTGSGMTGGGA